ncbi:PRTRC system ThiF family protein [uncultured Pseudoalteromonas sp.]|uniref:PRTRC system ThiF family protein n=1 Tax=uncultured Pseudoalteromonas sp. TaxID=114053 RepID=UPI00259625F0|nr:PRTRC system ThiF family protein [uncultured Pseudoalteromonas sp.]
MSKLFTTPTNLIAKPISIVVIGAGGTGSNLLNLLFQQDYLLRSITDGQIYFDVTVFDDDVVSHTNIGRQAFWGCDLGVSKAEILVNRYNVHGNLNWQYYNERVTKDNIQKLKHADVVITCVDKAKVRAEIGECFNSSMSSLYNKDMLWIDAGNNKSAGQVIIGHCLPQANKLPNVYDLYPELSEIVDIEEDSCSHAAALERQTFGINQKVALEATGLLWSLIREGGLDNHGSYIDMEQGTVKPLKIDPMNWAILGYTATA